MDQVLEHALLRRPEPISWDESMMPKTTGTNPDEEAPGFVAH